MLGLEIVLVIGAIVSGFTGSLTVLNQWKARRREKQREQLEAKVGQSLVLGSRGAQSEYDSYFARLGQAFALGDAVGRAQVQEQLIFLQSNVISMLQAMLTTGDGDSMGLVESRLGSIFDASESARKGTVRALQDQFQRMSVAAPIPRQVAILEPPKPTKPMKPAKPTKPMKPLRPSKPAKPEQRARLTKGNPSCSTLVENSNDRSSARSTSSSSSTMLGSIPSLS